MGYAYYGGGGLNYTGLHVLLAVVGRGGGANTNPIRWFVIRGTCLMGGGGGLYY